MLGIAKSVLEKPLALYYCLKDPETPRGPKLLACAVLAYFVSPIDFIPDLLLPGVGFVDDVVLLAITLSTVSRYVRPQHVAQARRLLAPRSGRRQEEPLRKEKTGQHDPSSQTGRRTEDDYANILGLDGNITPSHIKACYSNLAKKYHPDRVQHLGSEFREMAERKMTEINEAYQYFKNRLAGL